MKLTPFAKFAWGVLAYNLAVVAWGAYVRATGSGAGCGDHWPRCDGEVIPRLASAEQVIEFTHRVTSGIAALLVLGMLVWALRAFPRGHVVRRAAAASMVLMVIEALLGAGLVLFQLVADNASGYRAFSMVAHLVNTFFLLGAIALTGWWASGGRPVRLRGQGAAAALLAVGVAGMVVLGASGAIAALGDTLFPATSLREGIRQDFSPTAHFLLRLRIFHPAIALAVGAYLVLAARLVARLRPGRTTRRLALALAVLYAVQIGAGFLNLALLAPVWMQLVHLLLADLVWISLVLFGASALAVPEEAAHPARPVREQAPALA
ncbi:MAG TPA: COX15/CtaA family protein [Longimicrobiaceae bacterium]|nr:COX15/CtaA family protein [Longimicrobiaceae bacterium]